MAYSSSSDDLGGYSSDSSFYEGDNPKIKAGCSEYRSSTGMVKRNKCYSAATGFKTAAKMSQELFNRGLHYKNLSKKLTKHTEDMLGNTADAKACKHETEALAQMYWDVYVVLRACAEGNTWSGPQTRNAATCSTYNSPLGPGFTQNPTTYATAAARWKIG